MKIKVLHIIKSLGRGGAEMLLPETLQYHDQDRFEFHYIYFLPWKNQMVESIEEAGGRVVCFSASNNFQLIVQAGKVIKYIKNNHIDLVHCHLPWAGFLGRFVHFVTGIPLIYTEHNKQERYHFVTRFINRFSFRLQNVVVAVSDDVARSIKQNIRSQVPVITILNGVNTDRFTRSPGKRQELRRILNFNDNTIVIGTIAVFRFQKRLDVWMDVFKKLKEMNFSIKGVIVGDGPLMNSLVAKRKSLGLEDDILLPGLQTNTVDWLSAFDIYMMSSVFEGLPVALLEALSCGLPVAATSAGGIGEVIEDNVDGLLVSVDAPLLLVEKLNSLLIDPSLRYRLGKEGKDKVLSKFGMRRMVVDLETLYISQLK